MSEPQSIESKEAQVFVSPTSPISQPLLSSIVSPKSNSSEFPVTTKGPNWKQKIGRYGIFVVGFGTIAVIGAITFLSYLWAGIQDQTVSQSLRRKIITSNRLAISITLTSLVIRIAVTLQAGVFTSMFAAFLLEYGAVSRHAVPELSIMRTSSTGPYYMTWLLVKELSVRKTMIFTLGLILATTTFLSQFTSTVLLSDLNLGELANTSTVAFARSQDASELLSYYGSDYWSNRLGTYPVFAEANAKPLREQEGLVDTGYTLRALLPYTRSEERTKLRAYAGMAMLIDVRTVCMTTTITDAKISSGPDGSRLIGTVAFPMPEGYSVTETLMNSTFSCVLATRSEVDIAKMKNERVSGEWTTTLCRIRMPSTFGQTYFQIYGGGFFILNTRSSPQLADTSIPMDHTVKTLKTTGPWTILSTADLNYTLAVSLCLTPSISTATGVNITSDEGLGRLTEPSVTWNTTTETFNTAAVRHQLGVLSNTSASDSRSSRNILNLSFTGQSATGSRFPSAGERPPIEVHKFIERKAGAISTAAMCAFCKFDESAAFAVHNVLVAVFQDILATTGNPALALQAHYHALLAMAYYDFLPEADVTANATTISQVDLLMPTSRRGFTAVVVVLCTHLVCAVFTIMLFIKGTKLSRLGDGSWMAVAQVAAGDVSHVVMASTRLGDGEVKRRIRGLSGKEGGRDRDLRLGRLPDGRIGFVPAGPSQTSLRRWLF